MDLYKRQFQQLENVVVRYREMFDSIQRLRVICSWAIEKEKHNAIEPMFDVIEIKNENWVNWEDS